MTHDWLKELSDPPLIVAAMSKFGLKEKEGAENNPAIMTMATIVEDSRPGSAKEYNADSIPWCGLFLAWCCIQCGYFFPDKPLWALNWAGFGERVLGPVDRPSLGDVLVFNRYDAAGKFIGGHVGLYVGEDETHFHVLGGNQGDAVSVARIERKRLHQARRPKGVGEVKPMLLSADGGAVSTNEA